MHRGRGGLQRKDYTLVRDGQSPIDLEKGATKKTGATIWRLMSLAKEEVWVLILATVALIIGSLGTVAVPKLAGMLIDVCINYAGGDLDADTAKQKLNMMLYAILGVLGIGGLASGVRAWLFNSASERVMFRLRNRLFRHLIGQEVGFFDRVRTGELMNRLSEDTRQMRSAGTVNLSIALRSTVVCAFGLVLMFTTSVLLTSLTLAMLPGLMLGFRTFSSINKKYVSDGLTASAGAATVAEECFGSLRTVRSFAKEKAASERYEAAQQSVLNCGLKSALLSGFFISFMTSLSSGGIIVVLWFGARLVVDGKLTPGDLSAFVIYAVFVGSNFGSLADVFSQLVTAVGASERVFELLDRDPHMSPAGDAAPLGSPAGGDIEFRDVWFEYPSRPDHPVLKGINLHVPPGRKVALVGQSGGGKSTVVNLVERFYDPTMGEVLLDGVPLPDIDHEHLHAQISIVSQEPVLFAESIAYNIAFGMPGGLQGVSMQQIEEAAKIANAHEFIASFPQGYETAVGERGVRLSGGQKQRVAIARAILTQPRVLLLDEATSALDAESEHLVQEALDRAAKGRTVLVIAHRLSTVQSADEVAVVAGGTIAELGTHEQLMSQGGIYANLVHRQLTSGTSNGQAQNGGNGVEDSPDSRLGSVDAEDVLGLSTANKSPV